MTPLKADIRFKKISSLNKQQSAKTASKVLLLGVLANKSAKGPRFKLSSAAKDNWAKTELQNLEAFKRFKADSGKILVTHPPEESANYQEVAFFGLGETQNASAQDLLNIGAQIAQNIKTQNFTQVDIWIDSFFGLSNAVGTDFANRKLPAPKMNNIDALEKILSGLHLGLYSFDQYKSKKEKTDKISIQLLSSHLNEALVRKLITRVQSMSESVYIARDLMNTPGNDLRPPDLAKRATELGKKAGYQTQVWDEKKLKAEKMNGILSVGQGSDAGPRLIIMQHNASKKNLPTLVLVGKGITFDTGGVSLKPSAGMEAMKMDMGGSATVIAAMYGIAKLKLPLRVIALVAAAENMPDAKASRPGDIITSCNGKTVEIINTDAEGRLVLMDALEYAKTLKPHAVVDVATLTGAVVVALGGACTGIMGNNGRLIEAFKSAAYGAGEPCWELPLFKSYSDDMKSRVADLQNIGSSRAAGSSKAGAFLEAFVEGAYPWLHVDIAGVMDATKEQGAHCVGGASGIPTRSLIHLAENFKKKI